MQCLSIMSPRPDLNTLIKRKNVACMSIKNHHHFTCIMSLQTKGMSNVYKQCHNQLGDIKYYMMLPFNCLSLFFTVVSDSGWQDIFRNIYAGKIRNFGN